MAKFVWVIRPGLEASLGFTYRALVERLGLRRARVFSIEGPIRNVGLPRKQAFGVSARSAFDHRGHLIASRFGGPNAWVNLVAMHGLVNMNGGPWYQMERSIAKTLEASEQSGREAPRTGWMRVTVRYHEASVLRPIAFHVEVKDPKGAVRFWQIANANPHLRSPHDPRPRDTGEHSIEEEELTAKLSDEAFG